MQLRLAGSPGQESVVHDRDQGYLSVYVI